MECIKKVAAIHDLSGLGRCSLTAAIPILSVLGTQVCPFPTAILSCQTGYSDFSFLDLTEEMKVYEKNWSYMNFKFEGIYSGFLGSLKQIDIVRDFIKEQKDAFVFIDPVMGDNGRVYKTYTKEMCSGMKELVKSADVVTPNFTEACILTNNEYVENNIDEDNMKCILKEISKIGPNKVVVTGVIKDNNIYNYAYDKEKDEYFTSKSKRIEISYSGTGDIFASILCGMLMNKKDFRYSVEKATKFIEEAIKYSINLDSDPKNGVSFEPLLKELIY